MDLSFLEELAKEELRFKKFSLVGTGNVQAAGSLKAGYAVNVGVEDEAGAGPTTGACCDGEDCSITTEADCTGTYQGDGTPCDPNPCATDGACCIDGECSILTEADCAEAGGDYQGDGTDCDPNPCVATGACCHGTDCDIETEADCVGSDGIYGGDGTSCSPNPCLHIGACCEGLKCTIRTHDDCTAVGGTYHDDGSTCSDFNGPTCLCFEFAASITVVFSGVTIPGCCVGSEFVYIDCNVDGCINSTYVATDFVSFSPYIFYGGVDFRTEQHDYATSGVCFSGDFDTVGIRAPSIVIGCTESGWFIEAWATDTGHPIFAAHGVSDPTMPFVNELICGSAPATSVAFPDPTSLAIGEGGTATIS